MLQKLKQLLEYLEDNIDLKKIEHRESLHQRALNFDKVARLPVIASFPFPQNEKFVPFPHGEIFDHPEKMLFNQFVNTFDQSPLLSLELGDDLPFSIRADFGCVVIASMFGAAIEQKDNNPPWVRHTDSKVSYDEILNTPVEDFEKGIIQRVVDRYNIFSDILKSYPSLESVTNITLPDLQGPFDNLELLRGSDTFIEMYSQKDLFHKAMAVITEAQTCLIEYLSRFIKERIDGFSHQHGFVIKGGVLLRNDTSTMVSPQMYRDMLAPYDEKILKAFNGGIHSCGNVDGIIEEFLNVNSISCFDFGQSELNDCKKVYNLASQKNIPLIRIAVREAELVNAEICSKLPTGLSLLFRAETFEHARSVIAQYKECARKQYA